MKDKDWINDIKINCVRFGLVEMKRNLEVNVSLEGKAEDVIKLFRMASSATRSFQKQSGLKCIDSCCRCCLSQQISATVLEFIPLAVWLLKTDQLNEWLLKIQALEENSSENCILLERRAPDSFSGRCGAYRFRPMLCRLFGFSAVLDKYSQPRLVTCREIKREYAELYEAAIKDISTGTLPVMKNFFMMLFTIDSDLGHHHFPINTAIRKALEYVAAYSYYRNRYSG